MDMETSNGFLQWGKLLWNKIFVGEKSALEKPQEIKNSENPGSVIINITVKGDLKIQQK